MKTIKVNQKQSIVIFLTIGTILLLIGIGAYVEMQMFKSKAIKTYGKITKLTKSYSKNSGGSYSYIPTFVFKDLQNNQIEVIANISTNPPIGEIGDSIPIIYHSDNPKGARIESTIMGIVFQLMFSGLGLFFIFAAIMEIRLINKSKDVTEA